MDSCNEVRSIIHPNIELTGSGDKPVTGKAQLGNLVVETDLTENTPYLNPAGASSSFVYSKEKQSQPLAAYPVTHLACVPKPLPLPSLLDTIDALELMAQTQKVLAPQEYDIFISKLGELRNERGPALQKSLEQDTLTEHGWFRPYWDDMYLQSRDATPVNVSFGLELESKEWFPREAGSLLSMAGAILAAYDHYRSIQEDKLAVDMERNKPLCMSQPGRLFSNRKAGSGKDKLIPCYKEGAEQHVIVLLRGQVYRLQVADQEGRRISQHRLAQQLAQLDKNKTGQTDIIDLTPMTAVDRNRCADLQARFIEFDENNKKLLEEIEGAFCCVCLDAAEESETPSISRQLLTGNGDNRWFDKSLQFVKLPKGGVGVTIEHTPADAGAWVPLINRITEVLKQESLLDGELCSGPELLIPKIDDQLRKDLIDASKNFHDELSQVELDDIVIKGIRQDDLRVKNISPDAFYQMVFQVAASKAGYTNPPTYESVSMRHFKNGRTECLRTLSSEVAALVASLKSHKSSEASKSELLITALKAHSNKIKACKKGSGVCRHLFALEKKWEELYKADGAKKPEIFTDSVYQDLVKKNTLSTSCVADPGISRFVFGPVEKDDGLGIAYYPTSDELRATISRREKHSEKAPAFAQKLESSAHELLNLLKLGRG